MARGALVPDITLSLRTGAENARVAVLSVLDLVAKSFGTTVPSNEGLCPSMTPGLEDDTMGFFSRVSCVLSAKISISDA